MSTTEGTTIGILSDFNAQNLAVLVQKNAAPARVKCVLAPFGQTIETLLNPGAEFWSQSGDAVLIWSLPARVAPSFQRVLSFEEFSIDELLSQVDAFAALVAKIPDNVRTIFVASWVAPEVERGLGPLEMANHGGIANALMRMNLRLADNFESNRRIVLLDASSWIARAGPSAYNPKLWYISKTPFQPAVFQEASKDIAASLAGILGRTKKVVVLDLDNTLWGGVVGDVGWEKLRLGGHDPVGEAYVDFQQNLKRLLNRGILLAIASKNEQETALEAIRRHPEMALKLDDFAAWRINWGDKAENIAQLMAELNLGLDSAVFLDDTPFERARVREALPDVFVPDLPTEPMEFASWLRGLRCFDRPFITKEDRARTGMYVADRQRKTLQTEVGSLNAWLDMLDLGVVVERLRAENLDRVVQLVNKTNQMNLSTRRVQSAELQSWAAEPAHSLWSFRVADKFGDYGLCGVGSLVHEGGKARLLDFLLSCRVMGRGVEEAMLAIAANHARSLGCEELFAEFLPTAKNQPCLAWFEKQPGLRKEGNVFRLRLDSAVASPKHIRLTQGPAE